MTSHDDLCKLLSHKNFDITTLDGDTSLTCITENKDLMRQFVSVATRRVSASRSSSYHLDGYFMFLYVFVGKKLISTNTILPILIILCTTQKKKIIITPDLKHFKP